MVNGKTIIIFYSSCFIYTAGTFPVQFSIRKKVIGTRAHEHMTGGTILDTMSILQFLCQRVLDGMCNNYIRMISFLTSFLTVFGLWHLLLIGKLSIFFDSMHKRR